MNETIRTLVSCLLLILLPFIFIEILAFFDKRSKYSLIKGYQGVKNE